MKSEAYLTGQAQPAPSRGPTAYLCINGRPQDPPEMKKYARSARTSRCFPGAFRILEPMNLCTLVPYNFSHFKF